MSAPLLALFGAAAVGLYVAHRRARQRAAERAAQRTAATVANVGRQVLSLAAAVVPAIADDDLDELDVDPGVTVTDLPTSPVAAAKDAQLRAILLRAEAGRATPVELRDGGILAIELGRYDVADQLAALADALEQRTGARPTSSPPLERGNKV